MNLARARELAWQKKQEGQRKIASDTGKLANKIGPAAYGHRERLNRLADSKK